MNYTGKRQNKWDVYATPLPSLNNTLLPFSLVGYLAAYFFTSSNVKHLERPVEATYNLISRQIQVTDSHAVEILWRQGFFGKGSLSRSEPSWWIREQNRLGIGQARFTSEELTAKRRIERREVKIQKAKEKLLAAGGSETLGAAEEAPPLLDSDTISSETANTAHLERTDTTKESERLPWSDPGNKEHLQVQPEEAFFLLFGLGCLNLRTIKSLGDDRQHSDALTITEAWQLFATASIPSSIADNVQPDNPFILNYVVYHHFRSLGWVVRSGVKFSVDWVLYRGSDGADNPFAGKGAGPPGGHAEFSVMMVKNYTDGRKRSESEVGSWKWLSTVNRVTSGVKKTLVLAYVTIPAPGTCSQAQLKTPQDCLQLYSVCEYVVKRFVPTRLRG